MKKKTIANFGKERVLDKLNHVKGGATATEYIILLILISNSGGPTGTIGAAGSPRP